MTTTLLILIAILLVAVLLLVLRQKPAGPVDLTQAIQQLAMISEQQLGARQATISTDLANKERNFSQMMERILRDLGEHRERLSRSDQENIRHFSTLKQELAAHQQATAQLASTTEGLKKILSNNQSRGQFGEQVAEDLLRLSGFSLNIDYVKQAASEDGRPDFSIKLPDGLLINVDVKFPYQNLQAMVETEDPGAKKQHAQLFKQDIKQKIKQLLTRNYINPGQTVDFVVMFIPNEMIFSYVYENLNDVWEEGMRNKIVFAGPFSFTAILRLVRQAHSALKMQQNTQVIIDSIKVFEKEWTKYSDDFKKFGDNIERVTKGYNALNTTRTQKLERAVDKVKLLDTVDQPSIAETTDLRLDE